MDGWQVNNELERIWKEMITVRLEVAFAICMEGVNKITKTIRTAGVRVKSDHSACAENKKQALPLASLLSRCAHALAMLSSEVV
jgi:hypothetical protein